MKTIQPDSLVTLNIRVADAETSTVMHSTFEQTPLTLKMGSGDLMASIERHMLGLEEGCHESFELAPDEAFGQYRQNLVERVPREDIPTEMNIEIDTVYAFPAPDGSSYPGLVRNLTPGHAIVDFNHPLAGRRVRIDVQIIGIL